MEVHFDAFSLHPTEGLTRDGRELHVTPKSLSVLSFLAARPGRVVTKDDLIRAVWQEVAVSDSALTSCIKELRRALDDDARCPRFIETLNRRGYRFIAVVAPTKTAPEDDAPPGSPLSPSPLLGGAVGAGFVGREPELAQIRELWTRAVTGRRQLILVCGEPGIGKTRLAAEFAKTGQQSGATVLVGRCDEEALVPYQAFVEALTWYVRTCPEHDLRAQLLDIGGGGELALLLPELRRRIHDVPPAPAMNPEGQRYRLFETVAELLAVASAARPTLLVFEDLHWADKPTLLMLRHVIRASEVASLCVVATYRASELARTHPLADMLADLRQERAVTRISLGGLGEAHVKELIDALIGADASAHLARWVADSTDGNPFFIGEMVRHLTETGALEQLQRVPVAGAGPAELCLPEGIKEVIGRRLSRLSDACNRTLSLAAVIGREFDIDVLEALGDVGERGLLGAMEEAVRAQLISEVPFRIGRFSFVHALIRETLYGELTTTRRVRVHRRVGEALERLTEGRANPPLADLAYHFVHTASADTADKAIDYATRAGDHAVEMLAHEDAARFYDMALQSLELKPGSETQGLRSELHARRAGAFGALAQWALQKQEIERALQHLDPLLVERRAELVTEMLGALFFLFDLPSLERAASEALAVAEQVDRSDLAANAIAWLARARSASGDLPGSLALEHAAMTRVGGGRTIAHAMQSLTHYLMGTAREGIRLSVEAAEMARSARDTTFTMHAFPHLGLNLGSAGRYAEATEAFEEARRFGQKYGVRPLLARATAMYAGLHLSMFDYAGAEALAHEARELGRSAGFTPSVVSAGIDLLLIFARRHDLSATEPLLTETLAAVAATPGWHEWLWRLRLCQVRAELACERGSLTDAVSEASEGIRQSHTRCRPKYQALGLMTRARALHGLGRTRDAITDARAAMVIARRIGDPALLLSAIETSLAIEGDDDVSAEAQALEADISRALPNETVRRRFSESEIVRRVRRH